jgi:hypothetical protein
VTADSDPPLASEAPANSLGPRRRTIVGRVVVAVLLTLGCLSVGGSSVTAESMVNGSAMPTAVDEVVAPVAGESSLRHRVAVARRRFEQVVLRVRRFDGARRCAHWLPVQFRLMPPVWRGPTVLRL